MALVGRRALDAMKQLLRADNINHAITRFSSAVTSVGLALLMVFTQTNQVFAQFNGNSGSESNLRKRGLIWIDPDGIIGERCNSNANTAINAGGPVLQALPAEIPEPYRTIFPQAATRINTDVALLTTIFYMEHGRGFPDPPAPYGNGEPWASSDVGASGPFQFMPDTWDSTVDLAQNAFQITLSDRQDLNDSAIAAAVLLRSLGATPGIMPIGDPENAIGRYWQEDSEANVVNIMASYNYGPGYDSRVERVTETENYVRGGAEFYQALVNGNLAGLIDPNTPQGNAPGALVNTGCSSANTGVTYTTLDSMVYYGQCHEPWGPQAYGGQDYCYSGCGPTSLAMIVATMTGQREVIPSTIGTIVMNKGLHGPDGIYHSAFTDPDILPKYGLKVQALGADMVAVKAVLQNGGLVIGAMGPPTFTQNGHIIVLRGVTPGGKILVADPNDSLVGLEDYQKKSTTEWDESVFASEGIYWGVTK